MGGSLNIEVIMNREQALKLAIEMLYDKRVENAIVSIGGWTFVLKKQDGEWIVKQEGKNE